MYQLTSWSRLAVSLFCGHHKWEGKNKCKKSTKSGIHLICNCEVKESNYTHVHTLAKKHSETVRLMGIFTITTVQISECTLFGWPVLSVVEGSLNFELETLWIFAIPVGHSPFSSMTYIFNLRIHFQSTNTFSIYELWQSRCCCCVKVCTGQTLLHGRQIAWSTPCVRKTKHRRSFIKLVYLSSLLDNVSEPIVFSVQSSFSPGH
jgi:hypothetical protein